MTKQRELEDLGSDASNALVLRLDSHRRSQVRTSIGSEEDNPVSIYAKLLSLRLALKGGRQCWLAEAT